MKKPILLFTVFLLIFGCVPKTPEIGYTIKITPEKIEKQLIKHFPITEEKDLLVIKLEDPTISIENRKIYAGVKVKIKYPPFIKLNGKTNVSGKIKYQPETGKIFLINPSIEYFAINGKIIISRNMPRVKEILNEVIQSIFRKIPIYTVKESYRKRVKSIKISGGNLLIRVGL